LVHPSLQKKAKKASKFQNIKNMSWDLIIEKKLIKKFLKSSNNFQKLTRFCHIQVGASLQKKKKKSRAFFFEVSKKLQIGAIYNIRKCKIKEYFILILINQCHTVTIGV
jgi:hypothetical protein